MLIETLPGPTPSLRGVGAMSARRRAEPAHLPAAGLAGSGLADRFCFWRGRSGRRYVFSVYRVGSHAEAVPHYPDAVVLAARRDAAGVRSLVAVGDSGSLPELSPLLTSCRHDGQSVDELHVHLLAGDRGARRAVLDDLAGAAAGP